MPRAFLILGGLVDILIALFLLLVFGWIVDSWHDPNGAWVGVVATTLWLGAFVLSAGAPIEGYRLSRRGAPYRRIALTVWLPACILTGICVIGFAIAPP